MDNKRGNIVKVWAFDGGGVVCVGWGGVRMWISIMFSSSHKVGNQLLWNLSIIKLMSFCNDPSIMQNATRVLYTAILKGQWQQ